MTADQVLAVLLWSVRYLRGEYRPRKPTAGQFLLSSFFGPPGDIHVQIQYALSPPQSPGNTFTASITTNGGPPVVTPSPGTPIVFTGNPGDLLVGTHVEIDVAGNASPPSEPATFTVPAIPDVPPLQPAPGVFSVVGP